MAALDSAADDKAAAGDGISAVSSADATALVARYHMQPVVADRPIQPRGLPTQRAALRTNGTVVRLALLASGRGKWWVVEDARPVLDELDAAVEGSAIDHVERDVGVAVVDAF